MTNGRSMAAAEVVGSPSDGATGLVPWIVASIAALSYPPLANAGVGVLVAAGLLMAARSTRRAMPTSMVIALAGFAASPLVSMGGSVDPAHGLRGFVAFAPGAMVALLVAGYLEPRTLRTLMRGLAVIVCGLAVVLAASALRWPSPATMEMADLTFFVVPNDVCFLAVLLPAALVLARSDRAADRGLAMAAPIATLGAAVLLRSRLGVTVVVLVTVATTGMFHPRRWGLLAAWTAALLIAVVAVDAVAGFALFEKVTSLTWLGRLAPWQVALAMFRDAPVIGHGPRTFAGLYPHYFQALDVTPWMDPRTTAWAHNLYLETLAEQGILGLGSLVAVFAAAFRLTATPSGAGRDLALAARAGLGALVLVGCVEASFVRLWVIVALSLWLGVAAAVTATGSRAEDADES